MPVRKRIELRKPRQPTIRQILVRLHFAELVKKRELRKGVQLFPRPLRLPKEEEK
jgi:hypothetical protein